MGMYDEITIEYRLPKELSKYQEEVWQTKDLWSLMHEYIITQEGRLIQTADWEDSIDHAFTSKVEIYDDTKFHGYMKLIAGNREKGFIEIVICFHMGNLEYIAKCVGIDGLEEN